MREFNLIDEDWVPVVMGGRPRSVSVREALINAHRIEGLAVSNPLQTVAVLRQVLLPVYLDACKAPTSPEEWARRWRAVALDEPALADYLARHHDSFHLFGERPFAQVADLHTARNETKPVSLLVASAATGNNVPLFSARTEADPPAMAPAEAALALLATHCWDTAAIKTGVVGDPEVKSGRTTGNPTGPLGSLGVTVPLGTTLAQTLLLNTPILPQGLRPDDRPQWRAAMLGPAWATRPALGLLDLLTWQSRRIRLVPEAGEDGHVVVRQVVLAAGDRLEPRPTDVEPHSAWRRVAKPQAGRPAVTPVRHVPGRDAWRGLQAMLATRPDDRNDRDAVDSTLLLKQGSSLRANRILPETYPLQVLTVGVAYGTQSAVVEDVIADLMPLPVAALDPSDTVRQLLDTVVEQAEALRAAANRLGDDLRQAAGGDKLHWDKGQRLGDSLIHEFTPVVRRMLAGLQHDPARDDEAEAAWRNTAYRIVMDFVEPVLESVPPQAFLGRGTAGGQEYRASVAEAWFRASVRKTLVIDKTPVPAPGA